MSHIIRCGRLVWCVTMQHLLRPKLRCVKFIHAHLMRMPTFLRNHAEISRTRTGDERADLESFYVARLSKTRA